MVTEERQVDKINIVKHLKITFRSFLAASIVGTVAMFVVHRLADA